MAIYLFFMIISINNFLYAIENDTVNQQKQTMDSVLPTSLAYHFKSSIAENIKDSQSQKASKDLMPKSKIIGVKSVSFSSSEKSTVHLSLNTRRNSDTTQSKITHSSMSKSLVHLSSKDLQPTREFPSLSSFSQTRHIKSSESISNSHATNIKASTILKLQNSTISKQKSTQLKSASIICPSQSPVIIISTVCPPVSLKSVVVTITKQINVTATFNSSATVVKTQTASSLQNGSVATRIQPTLSSSQHMTGSSVVPTMTPSPPIDLCQEVIAQFSEALSNMTTCTLRHFRPMEICSQCVAYYDALQKFRTVLFSDCGKVLVTDYNQNYQVISSMFATQDGIWNSLGCEKCYVQGSSTREFTPAFKAFLNLDDDITTCFNNSVLPSTPASNSTVIPAINITNQLVCKNCKHLYTRIQREYKWYKDDSEEVETSWCADINVAVNSTRHKWTYTYNCSTGRVKDLESIIAITCFFCFLPIVFYVGAKLHSDVKERKHANRYNYESN